MGFIFGNTIDADNLALNLDVSNTRSYPGTGTTWTDLSGNNRNFTLRNSPTFSSTNGGFITFNGTNQYADTTSIIQFGSGLSRTIEYVVRYKGGAGATTTFGQNRTADAPNTGWVAGNTLGLTWISNPSPPYGYTLTSPTTVVTNQWYHFMFSTTFPSGSGTWSADLCVNGALQNVSTTVVNNNSNRNYIVEICRHVNFTFSTTYGNYDVALFKVYTKKLTNTQMLRNYDSIKSRYGI
jgi:hypothetical protein